MLAAILTFFFSAPAQEPAAVLLRTDRVSGDITSVEVTEQSAGIIVRVKGRYTLTGQKNPKPLAGMTLRVWLLRADGTAVVQTQPRNNISVGNAGTNEDAMNFTFARTAREELRGVVVELNGKMFVCEITAKSVQ
jgi:hypothetical protein